MAVFRQIVLGLLVIAGTLALWVTYVPSATVWLEQTGLPARLGITLPQPAEAEADGGGRRGGGAARVVAAAVTMGTLNDQITAVGDGRAVRSVTVRSEATGRIAEITLEAGSYIEAGQVMVRLDDEAEQIALERASLMLTDAQDELERFAALERSGAVTEVRIREARLALRNAELAQRQAEFDLSQRIVRAPLSGWIGLLDTEEGARVPAQEPLATITDRSEILIDFRVPERTIGQVKVGMPVALAPLANRARSLTGEINAIDNVVDRASRTLRVQARIANDDDTLREGMAFSVKLAFEGDPYPVINPLSVQWSSEGSFVWAVRDGKATRVPIVIRQRNAESVLVEAELAEGEMVVTEGVQSLRPGAEVELSGPEPLDGAEARNGPRKQG
jgi:RND family efflux transporter MFP subunit